MKTHTFRITGIEFGKISKGDNKDKLYMTLTIKNPANRLSAPQKETLYEPEMSGLIEAYRKVFPKGSKFHGSNESLSEEGFTMMDALKSLKNTTDPDTLEETDMTLLPNCANVSIPTHGYYAQKYATDMNEHKAGDYIVDKDNFVKVYKSVTIFQAFDDEEGTQPSRGFETDRLVSNAMRNLVPLEKVLKENASLVPPQYLKDITIPTTAAGDLTAGSATEQQEGGDDF